MQQSEGGVGWLTINDGIIEFGTSHRPPGITHRQCDQYGGLIGTAIPVLLGLWEVVRKDFK
ncbi:hypothetical protein [Vibrio sp. ABG19]|uniref:hypothetical protein n=1 Tax=Vibrio sp. ABG19 TaxID=2817385 RepID=UPI00249E0BC5|nr:hypothetical protein [Vibrio sp. ABG19]WGY45933.1 hypothetical protein J0X00_04630 [Vibrio sp. ABG19]